MKRTLLALVAILCFSFAAMAADISGKWMRDPAAAPAGGGGGRGGAGATYTFKVEGSTLTGTISQAGRGGGAPTDTAITDGKVTGDTFTFSISRTGQDGTATKITYTGKVNGDKLELNFDMGRGPQSQVLVKAP